MFKLILAVAFCFTLGPIDSSAQVVSRGLAMGTIKVNAKPWAKCNIGGVAKLTPATFKARVGKVTVVCKRMGKVMKKTVRVRKNKTTRVMFNLMK